MLASDKLGMLFQDVLTVGVVGSFVLATVFTSLFFSTGFYDSLRSRVERFYGSDINWDLVHPHLYTNEDLEFTVYNVPVPGKPLKGLVSKQRYIRKHVLAAMDRCGVVLPLKDFTELFLRVNNNNLSLEYKEYGYYGGRGASLNRVQFSIEQVAVLIGLNADMGKVAVLNSKGLSFEQIVECVEMPVEWSLKLYDVGTVTSDRAPAVNRF